MSFTDIMQWLSIAALTTGSYYALQSSRWHRKRLSLLEARLRALQERR